METTPEKEQEMKEILQHHLFDSCCIYRLHDDFEPWMQVRVGFDYEWNFVLRLDVQYYGTWDDGDDTPHSYYIDYYCSREEAYSLAREVGCSLKELPAAFAIGFTEELKPQGPDDLVWFFDNDKDNPYLREDQDDQFDSFFLSRGYDLRDEVKDYLISRGVHLHKRRVEPGYPAPEEPLDLDLPPQMEQVWDALS